MNDGPVDFYGYPEPPADVKLPNPENSIKHEDVARVVDYDWEAQVTCYDDPAESA